MGYETIFLYVGVALGVSFLCSVLEAVLLSMTLSQINVLQNSGRRSGAIWAVLKEDVERPLTVILTLNTIAHTVGAIGVGSEVQNMYQDADFAVESGNLAKNQILQQAATAMVAQANASKMGVLTLLRG